jgi:hypothetical protein
LDTADPDADTVAPMILSTSPANGQRAGELESIRFVTSEPISESSLIGAYTVMLTPAAEVSGRPRGLAVTHIVDADGFVVVGDDEPLWGANGFYEVTISSTIADDAGNTLGFDYPLRFSLSR